MTMGVGMVLETPDLPVCCLASVDKPKLLIASKGCEQRMARWLERKESGMRLVLVASVLS
jgi:hypothetical protein